MPDLEKLNANKEKIINIIKESGPSYPGKISKETEISPLFAAAFLAELVSERKLKISNMKIGSSPIYFLIGQENNLENFIEHLNHKEKEAFSLLKDFQVLEDSQQTPAIRVALRKIKDFAKPLNVKINEESKLFWKFFSTPEIETKSKIQNLLNKKAPKNLNELQKSKEILNLPEKIPEKTEEKKKPTVKKISKPEKTGPEFSELVKDYLLAKDIEIMEELISKKKEFVSKVRIDTLFGKQEFLLTAKDKKKINTNDLTISLQNSQTEKMPSLILSPGELDKKAKEYIRDWKNLMKFERVKL
jgi:hypothetical protein